MGKHKDYINAPIELYRGFVDNPRYCLLGVLSYMIESGEDIEAYELGLDNVPGEDYFPDIEEVEYSGVVFSISTSLFRDYFNNDKQEWELRALLCFLALKSICGHKRIGVTNSFFMLVRMCGYAGWGDFNETSTEDLGKLGKLFSSESNTRKAVQRIKKDTVKLFGTLHCYAHTGMRQFVYTFSTDSDEECQQRLIEYVKKYYNTKI